MQYRIDLFERGMRLFTLRARLRVHTVEWLGTVYYSGVAGALGLDQDGRYHMYRTGCPPMPLNTAAVLEAIEGAMLQSRRSERT